MVAITVCILAGAVAHAARLPVPPEMISAAPAIVLAEGGGDATRNRVVQEAQKRYNAQVVRVTEVTVGGRRAYELRLLSGQGRVWTVRIDAENGQELPGG